jgi:hypothetical protein
MSGFRLLGVAIVATFLSACGSGTSTLPPSTVNPAELNSMAASRATTALAGPSAPASPSVPAGGAWNKSDLSVSPTSLSFAALGATQTFQAIEDKDSKDDDHFRASAVSSNSAVCTVKPKDAEAKNARITFTVTAVSPGSCTITVTDLSDHRMRKPTATVSVTVTGGSPTKLPTTPQSGTISLPAGSKLALGSLTVFNSLSTAHPTSTGAFTLTAFSGGPQLALVTDASANPVLMGFLGASSTAVNAQTTAQVLLYFATGCYLLTPDLRTQAVALIPQAPGFGTLVSAISNALASSGTPFATPNAAVTSALNNLVAALYAGAAKAAQASSTRVARRPQSVVINPNPGTQVSGINVALDFPDGVHMINSYRRRAVSFVDQISYVDANGNLVTNPAPVPLLATPAPIPPVNGVNGGAISTLVDIFNGNFAFSPISTPTIPLPLVPNSQKTTYALTIVGPGTNLGAVASLDSTKNLARLVVDGQYLIQDLLTPLIANVLLPLNSKAIDTALSFTGGASVVTDFVNLLFSQVPALKTEMQQGQVSQTLFDTYRDISESNTLTADFQQKILDLVFTQTGFAGQEVAFNAFTKWNNAISLVNGALTIFDTSINEKELLNSDFADTWSIDVIPSKATLSPTSANVANGATAIYTANVPAASGSGSNFQYTWQNTANFGHLTDGKAGHTDNFTSTSNSVTYTANATGTGTDTITVQVATLNAPGQPPINVGGPLTASATVVAGPSCAGLGGTLYTFVPSGGVVTDSEPPLASISIAYPSYGYSSDGGVTFKPGRAVQACLGFYLQGTTNGNPAGTLTGMHVTFLGGTQGVNFIQFATDNSLTATVTNSAFNNGDIIAAYTGIGVGSAPAVGTMATLPSPLSGVLFGSGAHPDFVYKDLGQPIASNASGSLAHAVRLPSLSRH